MATKVSNGNTIAPPRPPFRRQGSSVAGTQHPMTVALAPMPKVDYSVTKGGARTWAVLFVFFVLCSSLYTVFSAKEVAELAVDMDGDGHFDLDDDLSDDMDSVAEHSRRSIKDSKVAEENRPREKGHHHHSSTKHHSPVVETTSDDDEAGDPEPELESQLFAGLRKKIESNIRKVKKMVEETKSTHEDADEADEQEEEEEIVPVRERRRRHKKEKIEEPKQKEQKRSPKRRRVVEEEPVEEEESENDSKESEEDEDDDEEDDTVVERNKEDDDNEPDESKDEPEETGEKSEEEEEMELEEDDTVVRRRQRRRHGTSHITLAAPDRACNRKHCPLGDVAQPRKSLLKQKRGGSTNPKKYQQLSAADLASFDDDLDDEEEDDESAEQVEEPEPVMELVAIKKYRSSGREAYKRHAITNKNDHKHRESLDKADFLVEKHDYASAIQLFDEVLRVQPDSPRAHFGKGRAFDIRGEYLSDERDIDRAIHEYEEVLENEDTPEALFRQAASRLIDRTRFRGQMHKCLQAQRSLIDSIENILCFRFPSEMSLQTDFAMTFLMMRRHEDARKIFKDILEIDNNNAIALAYYGYILKVVDNDIEGGVAYMRKGLRLGAEEITDAKFYYHLGHALMSLGRNSEAYSVYEQGAELGLFLSSHQRSMYNIEGLTGRPWWSLEQTGYSKHLKPLERQWVSIRHEAVLALTDHPDQWEEEDEVLKTDGDWLSYYLYRNGDLDAENCQLTPQTCAVIEDFRRSSNASRDEIYFSVLSSGAQVLAHCGPTNTRLQAHMGLVVPSEARIRVGQEQRGWKTGKFIIFDDSFEHEMNFDGASSSSFRLILVLDLWHPEVDARHRADYSENE